MNLKISADDTRRIHLPGVGEVARPVDVDTNLTGFRHLTSLRVYKFLQGQTIDGEAEGDEVCIVFMSGDATFAVEGETSHVWTVEGRKDVFEAAPFVVYLPPRHSYRLTPHGDAEIAYARSSAQGNFPPRLIRPAEVRTESHAGVRVRSLLPPGAAEHLLCSEVVQSGVWFPYPPHKHDENAGNEVALEQLSHYRLNPAAFALARVYNEDSEEAFTLLHRDTLAIGKGYHTVAVPPGCTLYGLHLMAGAGSAYGVSTDPALRTP